MSARIVSLVIPAKAEYIALGRLALTGLLRPRAVEPEVIADIKLALTEACSNSIRHAYADGRRGAVEIRYELADSSLAVEVSDEGAGFDSDRLDAEPAELDEGGLGIAIIRALTDDLSIGRACRRDRLLRPLHEEPVLERGFPNPPGSERPARAVSSASVQLQLVNVGTKLLREYASIATRGLMDQIRALAGPLEGKRVLHLSATAFGGGVAEILYTLVPLMRDAGLDVGVADHPGRGRVLRRHEDDPQRASRAIRPGSTRSRRRSSSATRMNAEALEGKYDFVIVHDPQPAGVVEHARDVGRHWIWRCHIDLSDAESRRARLPAARRSAATTRRSSTAASTFRTRTPCRPPGSGRRPSIRWLRRTWLCRPRTPATSSTSSASTSLAR